MPKPKKYKFPTNTELLKTKVIYRAKKDPIWVTLEKEMREKEEQGIKAYNEKVGKWLKFLRTRIYKIYKTEKKHYNLAKTQIGPTWYFEFSPSQRAVLSSLKRCMHHDHFLNTPANTREAVKQLGITLNFSDEMLMEAIKYAIGDAAIFFWHLYTLYYEKPPSELLSYYDENSRYMMSALVFADLEQCEKALIKFTENKPRPPPKAPKKPPPNYFQPRVKYGEYLQEIRVPFVSNHPDKIPKKKKPMPLKNKIKLRSEDSYTKLIKDEQFMELRREKNRREQMRERVCTYKFWEPPGSLRNTDPKMVPYINKLTMFKKRPKARHLAYKPPFDSVQNYIKGVSYSSGKPVYHIETYSVFPTGWIPINGGNVKLNGEYVLNILGYYRYPNEPVEKCESECDCLMKRQSAVFRHLKDTKCECGHAYDLDNSGNLNRKYFYPPNGTEPFWIDEPQVYQFDLWEDFIKYDVNKALRSPETSTAKTSVTLSPTKLKKKDLLAECLAQLAHTTLMIPHLPKANQLRNLQELVRLQVKGEYSKKKHSKMLYKAKRKWLHFDHVEWFTRAYQIPFTKKQLKEMNFNHREQFQELIETIIRNFESRTRKSWMEFTRMFWHTMNYDIYPNKRFLDTFFAYMPVRAFDMHVLNPYSPDTTPKYGARTCKLGERITPIF